MKKTWGGQGKEGLHASNTKKNPHRTGKVASDPLVKKGNIFGGEFVGGNCIQDALGAGQFVRGEAAPKKRATERERLEGSGATPKRLKSWQVGQ